MVTVIIAITLKMAFFVRSQNVQTNPNTKHNWNFMEISILISAAVYLRKPTLRVVQGDNFVMAVKFLFTEISI